MRNHQAVIDTANGTINFPHVKMTLAMPDEMKNCNPKPLQIMAEGNQTLLLQQKNNSKRNGNHHHHHHKRRHLCDTVTTTI